MPGKSAAQVLGTRGTGINFGKKKSRKIVDPLGLVKSGPKKPKKTPEEIALGIRQRSLLDDEIEESEKRFKAMARGNLGRSSLLGSAATNQAGAAGAAGAFNSGGSSRRSGTLLSGGGDSGGGSSASSVRPTPSRRAIR